MKKNFLKDASVYVGTYHKYNSGSIFGEWLYLSDYNDKEEFIEACKELHKDEKDPEFMFQDYENIPEGLISESWIDGKVWDLMQEASDFDETECEALCAYIDCESIDIRDVEVTSLIEDFRDSYCGKYDSEEEYAEEFAPECFPEIETSDMGRYFDYAAFTRDIFINDFTFWDGFVFRAA